MPRVEVFLCLNVPVPKVFSAVADSLPEVYDIKRLNHLARYGYPVLVFIRVSRQLLKKERKKHKKLLLFLP